MIFSKNEITNVYTVEQCTSCKNESKRKFKEGDYVFSESSNCPSCEAKMVIEKIFGETLEQ